MKRDASTNALIETDIEALNKYREERKKVAQIVALRKEVDHMKTQIDDLYKIIHKLSSEKV